MKKVLIGLLVLVVLIAIGTSVFLGNMDGLIKDTIETEGTAALGSQVSVESVVTDLRNGTAVIKGMTIANVAGYNLANAVQIDLLQADVDYQNMLINEILIDQPVINAELKGNRSNFQDLMDNMPATEEVAEESDDSDMPEITIKSFQLNRATVNLVSDQIGERSFVMDNLTINDLVGTPGHISDVITTRLTNHITQQVKNYAAAEIKSRVKEEVKNRVKEKANEQLNSTIQSQVGGKLKGLNLKIGTN